MRIRRFLCWLFGHTDVLLMPFGSVPQAKRDDSEVWLNCRRCGKVFRLGDE